MTNREILHRAAEKILVKGLAKLDYGTKGGPVCAVGAIREVCTGDPLKTSMEAREVVARINRKMLLEDQYPHWSLSEANDRYNTTQEDMVMFLLLAAEVIGK
jgi:hypothetical protein